MLEESQLSSAALVDAVLSLLEDRERLRRMGEAARKLSHPRAAMDIARMAASLAGITQAAETRNS
jgi:UDP-N-acetylglucosamine--N-acetylmuramyl-(pentapeptide) pyrophosphoryl-undecaprenol N-acetylglucosamine transferase